MIRKVLIANRGEIAVRIARACKDYGVASVAVYADPDAQALHVRCADEAWALQGTSSAQTYLDIAKLIGVAQRSGADAVHPGYGFLSERAEFARAVQEAGLTWIGPPPATIETLGDKVAARKMALQVGAPLVAGTTEPVSGAQEVLNFIDQHGVPVAIKAAFGGGGRGIKVVWQAEQAQALYASAVREATAAFGRGECFVEQFLDRPRHIEAQVLADQHGNVLVVGTRDCSLQRRNQKLVEEAPAPFLSDAQRHSIHTAARDICAAAGYVGAGTVEFLLSQSGQISFLEVNTRLQVEHPVTEETAGIDLVLEQLRIADGLPLSLKETPAPRGHSFEFRINAEDPGRGYLPTPGDITRFDVPSGPGVRIDSGVVQGSTVSGSFDSMMAKLIVTGATREQALARAQRALDEFHIEGVPCVLPFHRAVVRHAAFQAQPTFAVHTRWIETEMATDFAPSQRPDLPVDSALHRCWIELDGKRMQLGLPAAWLQAGITHALPMATPHTTGLLPVATDEVTAPMAGGFVGWKLGNGTPVHAGDVVAVMESMKMEVAIAAHSDGVLHHGVQTGDTLQAGQALGHIRPA